MANQALTRRERIPMKTSQRVFQLNVRLPPTLPKRHEQRCNKVKQEEKRINITHNLELLTVSSSRPAEISNARCAEVV